MRSLRLLAPQAPLSSRFSFNVGLHSLRPTAAITFSGKNRMCQLYIAASSLYSTIYMDLAHCFYWEMGTTICPRQDRTGPPQWAFDRAFSLSQKKRAVIDRAHRGTAKPTSVEHRTQAGQALAG